MTKLFTKTHCGEFEELTKLTVYVLTDTGYCGGDDLPSEVYTEHALVEHAEQCREENNEDYEPIDTLDSAIEYLSEYHDMYVEECEVIL